jgi:hypothetical protein
MTYRHSVKLENSFGKPLRIVIEPWATEFELPSKESCEVVAVNDMKQPRVDIEVSEYGILFWVEVEGSVYEYWQNGVLID